MSPKITAVLTIIFAVVISLSILGVFDIPLAKNQSFNPTVTPTLKTALSKSSSAQFNFPKFSPAPIKTPQRTPSTLRISSTASPGQNAQSTQIPSPPIFENFEQSKLKQPFTVLNSFGIPFGGRVTSIEGCNSLICGGADQMITVGPPRGGTFAINGGTTIYEFYDWSVGNWVLGLADGFDICYIYDPLADICFPVNAGPAINLMGTSQ